MLTGSNFAFHFLELSRTLIVEQSIRNVNSKNYIKKVLAGIFCFLSVTYLSAQIDLNINTNQIEGVAPLHVTFDATGTTGLANNNYVLANFVWNFDSTNTDPNGKWEKTKGFFTAHVFEKPGTYTVSVTVKDIDGVTASKNITIKVTEFNKTTYYVAANGNNSNSGTTEREPLLTLGEGLHRASSGDRILLKNGDVIIASSAINLDKNNLSIGTYGEGDKAILNITATSRGGITIDNESNIRLMDFHLKMPNQANTPIKFGGSNNLAYNLEISETGGGAAIEHNRGTNNVIWNGYFHDFGPYGIFCQQFDKIAIIGVKIRNLNFPKHEHGIRAVSGSKLFIANCDFVTEIAKTAFAIRYNGKDTHIPTNHIVMVDNKVDRQVQGGWVNDLQGGRPIQYVLFEGNYITPSKFPNSGYSPDFSGLKFRWASNVAVRNNVISKKARAIIIEGNDNAAEPISNIWVYNNTIIDLNNGSDVTGSSAIGITVNNPSIEFKNNIYYTDHFNSRMFTEAPIGSTATNNLHYRTAGGSYNDPDGVIHSDPDFVSFDDTSSDFAQLSVGSTAIDAGASVSVFYDKKGNERIGTIDLGAYEFSNNVSDYMNVSPLGVDLEYLSEDVTIDITSNIEWSASSDLSWITISPDSGTANGVVTISVSENTTSDSRAGTIIFTGTGVTNKTLTVIQQGVSGCITSFTETFDSTNLTSRYTFNNFTGANDIEWSYTKGVAGDVITPGDTKTIQLDKNGTGTLSATIPGGIGSISAACMKAGRTGNGALDIKVNGEVVASYFSSDNDVITISATGLTAGPNDIVEFVTTAEKPIIIDDITITSCLGSNTSLTYEIENLRSNKLTVHPNPVSKGSFIIETKGFEKPTLRIYRALDGKVIYRKENLSQYDTVKIDNFLKPGLYIIQVADKTNERTSKLVVE